VYAEPPQLSIELERPLTLVLLVVSAAGSWALGALAIYLLLRRARPLVAGPLILICCVPALLGAALDTHALLVFLTIV
jgi:hypothetical protein